MRQIIIDTETTGLDTALGHRIIELAAVEIVNRRATGRTVHFRIDPERDIDFGATEVHGMTWEDLKGRPKFRDVAAEFVDFARGAEWIIHNAPFDVGFLDRELKLASLPGCDEIAGSVIDTLALARDMFPGKRNGLDALCDRFDIDNSHRSLHGALLDAQLLSDVYLAMTRGQESLTIEIIATSSALSDAAGAGATGSTLPLPAIIVIAATELEEAAHREYLALLDRESKGRCIWLALESSAQDPALRPIAA